MLVNAGRLSFNDLRIRTGEPDSSPWGTRGGGRKFIGS